MTPREEWNTYTLTVMTILYIIFGATLVEGLPAYTIALFVAGSLCLVVGWIEVSSIVEKL